MAIVLIALSALIAVSVAGPIESAPRNVIVVPPNCPPGQQWINGQCRDVWRMSQASSLPELEELEEEIENLPLDAFNPDSYAAYVEEARNVVTVRPNCPDGQVWVYPPGVCKEVWAMFNEVAPMNVETKCPSGQVLLNGSCLPESFLLLESKLGDIFKKMLGHSLQSNDVPAIQNKKIIGVPTKCPVGYKHDALGICRPIF